MMLKYSVVLFLLSVFLRSSTSDNVTDICTKCADSKDKGSCKVTIGEKKQERPLQFFKNSWFYKHLPEYPDGHGINWYGAQYYCNMWLNSTLASIHSQQEFDFIVKDYNQTFFIGGQYNAPDTSGWTWTDGTSTKWMLKNAKWNKKGYNETALEIKMNKLNDVSHNKKRDLFVCKKKCNY